MGTIDQICKKCGKHFKAKAADVKRGWAKCCSKACAAYMREKKLDRFNYRHGGQHPGEWPAKTDTMERINDECYEEGMACLEDGWDGHKNIL